MSPDEDDTLAGTGGSGREPDVGELVRGDALARFLVLERIGRGGMGTVYAAYDPELYRRVALKLMHSTSGAAGHERLVREAKAMARLSHPNVVAAHEVGAIGTGSTRTVFIAMEFVAGRTLGA